MPVNKAADHLYGLPREEFIAARKEAVKELREKGNVEAAEEVAALPKPTVAAWALNQVQRRDGKAMEELIAAAHRLRAAQRALLEGDDRAGLDEAQREERRLTEQVVDAARSELDSPSEATITRVRDTLSGLGLDDSLEADLGRGRLAKDREAVGGFGFDPAVVPAPSKRSRQAAKKAGDQKADKRRKEKAAKALAAAEDALREKEAELREAEQDLARARSAVERAKTARDKAERKVKAARKAG